MFILAIRSSFRPYQPASQQLVETLVGEFPILKSAGVILLFVPWAFALVLAGSSSAASAPSENEHQARRVSSRQLRPSSTTSREASVKAMTPTAAKVSPRWLQ